MLQDVYGNRTRTRTWARSPQRYPAPKPQKVSKREIQQELELPEQGRRRRPSPRRTPTARPRARRSSAGRKAAPRRQTQAARRRAHASRPARPPRSACSPTRAARTRPSAGGAQQEFERTGRIDGVSTFQGYFTRVFGLDRDDVRLKPLKAGSHVIAGHDPRPHRQDAAPSSAPHTLFEIRPAGRGAPRIDPKPILDGWKLLESTAIYRAAGKNPFFGPDADAPSIGQILLMSKEALAERVAQRPAHRGLRLRPPRHPDRPDRPPRARDARVPRRLGPQARPSPRSSAATAYMTASGNVSEHSTGNAVDIAAVNGIPIVGHQGPGSITDMTIQRLLTLQGTMKPHQIISLMTFDGHRQHARDGRPRRPHPRRLPAAVRQQLEDRQAGQRDPQAQAVDQADRPARRDRQPDRAPLAVAYALDAPKPSRASDAHTGE